MSVFEVQEGLKIKGKGQCLAPAYAFVYGFELSPKGLLMIQAQAITLAQNHEHPLVIPAQDNHSWLSGPA